MIRFLYIVGLLALMGCGENNRCLKTIGEETSIETVIEESFDKIYVEDRIKVVLVQNVSEVGKIVMSGPKNLLNSIGMEVNDGELRLTNDNTCNFLRSFDYQLRVVVYVDQLSQLSVASIAEVSCKDTIAIEKLEVTHVALSDINLLIKGEEVFIRSRNSATTVLRGEVNALKGSIEDVSDLDAKELSSKEVLLDTHSPLNCKINAEEGYFLNIYNAGNIEQYGSASSYRIVNERTGTGNVVQK